MPEQREGHPEAREGPKCDAPDAGPIRRVAKRRLCIAVVVAIGSCICVACQIANDWPLAPGLAIVAALVWHTRYDAYAALPGFAIGFVVGVVTSAGVGQPAAFGCGLFVGALGVPLNAICRGFWRAGAAALTGILASWYVVALLAVVLWGWG
jgi:hypothetical protein